MMAQVTTGGMSIVSGLSQKKLLKRKTQTKRSWSSLPYCTILRIGNLMTGMNSAGPRQAAAWLNKNGVDPGLVDEVCEIISTLSYKGAGVATPMRTIEGKIVQDADRLDAIGAVGIARTFAYGGNKNRLMYHPEESPVMHESFEHYKNNKGHTINHFHEKLLLLKDRMNTESAKKLAEQRHLFMENYLDRFHKEWDGDA